MQRSTLVVALMVVAAGVTCGRDDDDSDETALCTPGSRVSCLCPDGTPRTRECYANGNGYGQCQGCATTGSTSTSGPGGTSSSANSTSQDVSSRASSASHLASSLGSSTSTSAASTSRPSSSSRGSSSGFSSASAGTCIPTCTVAEDCDRYAPLYSPVNFECRAGRCEWLGCTDVEECVYAFNNGNMVCAKESGDSVPMCHPTCQTVEDCNRDEPLYTPANFDCVQGRCQWHGCVSTEECVYALENGMAICAQEAGDPFPMCHQTCTVAADCSRDLPLYMEENYACTHGRCRWLGCMTDDDCIYAYENDYVICSRQ